MMEILRGQSIIVSESWLHNRGIYDPIIWHEDGYRLEVERTSTGSAFVIDVPHFSFVVIGPSTPDPLEVKGRQGGLVFDHDGEVRWHSLQAELEIDVDDKLLDYEVLIPKDWIDKRISRNHVDGHSWFVEDVDGTAYYVVSLLPEKTPTTLTIKEIPWDLHEFELNITEFQDDVEAGLPVVLPMGPEENLTVYLKNVTSTNSSIIFYENNTATDMSSMRFYEEIENETENGTIVHLTTSDEDGGLLSGFLCRAEIMWDFTSAPGGGLLQAGRAQKCPSEPSNYPYSPPEPPASREVSPHAHTDPTFRSSFSTKLDSGTHIIEALQLQQDMWRTYTGNSYPAKVIRHGPQIDFVGDGDYCEQFLRGFSTYLDDNGFRIQEKGFYMLVTANSTMPGTCLGVAWTERNTLPEEIDSVNYGWNSGSYHGRTSTQHLGKLIAHEVGHNWGEDEHSCPAVNDEYSVMATSACDGPTWDKTQFWLHYKHADKPDGASPSRERIISGTAEYDS